MPWFAVQRVTNKMKKDIAQEYTTLTDGSMTAMQMLRSPLNMDWICQKSFISFVMFNIISGRGRGFVFVFCIVYPDLLANTASLPAQFYACLFKSNSHRIYSKVSMRWTQRCISMTVPLGSLILRSFPAINVNKCPLLSNFPGEQT